MAIYVLQFFDRTCLSVYTVRLIIDPRSNHNATIRPGPLPMALLLVIDESTFIYYTAEVVRYALAMHLQIYQVTDVLLT